MFLQIGGYEGPDGLFNDPVVGGTVVDFAKRPEIRRYLIGQLDLEPLC
jgi:hypothetical protein